ncbi:MAG: molybdopterin-dependent oxidoreductase [Ardenticatenaceae bacterium]
MKTTINGQEFEFQVRPDESAVEVIRQRAQLTGTKLVCGAGVCGACTVLVDGVPMTSCLLPAHGMEGCGVQTVEAHDANNLHPVQRAFMAHDGLQCGFCTPGFIMEGIAFYERWRKQHGRAVPSREQVAAALAGHLCRCGAYVGIYTAMQRACAGDFDETKELVSPRVEAIEKVTGQAKYTMDIQQQGQLVGKIFRSPHANAKVLSLDLSAAKAINGVKAVVKLLEGEQTVRYVGHPIAAVAAINEQVAQEALKAIKVVYNVQPHVLDIQAARATGAPEVYQEGHKNAPTAAEGLSFPGRWAGNVRKLRLPLSTFGSRRVPKTLEQARTKDDMLLVEGSYRTQTQIHTAFEPHCCVAQWNGPDKLTLHMSTQATAMMAHEVAKHFDLNDEDVELINHHVGGGFGAKGALSIETIAAVTLARAAYAPVGVVLERYEEQAYAGYRPSTEIELKMAANQAAEMKALSAKAYSDAGVAINSFAAAMMRFIYSGGPRVLEDHDVVTNLPAGTPFRGPGGPPACWALEQAVDEVAHKLNMSPIALRKQWDDHELRQKLYDWVETIPAWRERGAVGSQTGRFRRGIGVAMGYWFYGYHFDSEVEITASADGIVVRMATQDIGTGARSVMAGAVAEVLGISPFEVSIQIGNSQAPHGPASGGSMATASLFYPTQQAAEKVRDLLVKAVEEELSLQDVKAVPGGVNHDDGYLPWEKILPRIRPVSATAKRGADSRFNPLPALTKMFTGMGMAIGRPSTGAVCVSEVEVDMLLGKVRVLRVWEGIAAGKIYAPKLARSQVHGAVIQGIGYALYEERNLDPTTGTILNLGLEEYRIPGIGDIPEIEVYFYEKGFEHAKGGGVGFSEVATVPVAASIGNAVFHATGRRHYELPIRPDRVLQGVK